MLNKKIKAVLKVILPMLFIAYTCSISFFTHTHIVNGVTIVHSHPYSTDDTGNPEHEHTGQEIQLIHTLSTFFATSLIVLTILLGLLSEKYSYLSPKTFQLFYTRSVESFYRLRPPPAL